MMQSIAISFEQSLFVGTDFSSLMF